MKGSVNGFFRWTKSEKKVGMTKKKNEGREEL